MIKTTKKHNQFILNDQLETIWKEALGVDTIKPDNEPYEVGDETNRSILDQFLCDLQNTGIYQHICGDRFGIESDYAANPSGEIKVLINDTRMPCYSYVIDTKDWNYKTVIQLFDFAVELLNLVESFKDRSFTVNELPKLSDIKLPGED